MSEQGLNVYYHQSTDELYIFEFSFAENCFFVETWNDIFRVNDNEGFIYIGDL